MTIREVSSWTLKPWKPCGCHSHLPRMYGRSTTIHYILCLTIPRVHTLRFTPRKQCIGIQKHVDNSGDDRIATLINPWKYYKSFVELHKLRTRASFVALSSVSIHQRSDHASNTARLPPRERKLWRAWNSSDCHVCTCCCIR